MEINFRLPDLFALTPFSTLEGCHESYVREDRSSTEWALGFSILPDHRSNRIYESEAELLANLAYNDPLTTKERLRIIGDYLVLLVVIDELTDEQDAVGANATREAFSKALVLDGKAKGGESPVVRFIVDYMDCIPKTSVAFRERFIRHLLGYIEATTNEAELRDEGKQLTSIEEYSSIRRHNGGMLGAFDLIEFSLGIELPVEVFEDPNFMRVYCAANDMVLYSNDIYSYAMEHGRKIDAVNSVTVIMNEKGFSLQEAINYVAGSYKELGDTMNAYRERIESYGPKEDENIQRYIDGLQQWVIGNLEWSFQNGRYFGKYSEEVRRTRVVNLAISHGMI